jgi:hypothetical protein
MVDEDTILEEAMDNLREAGQRMRATQSLMRSQVWPMARTTATFSRASRRRWSWPRLHTSKLGVGGIFNPP